MFYKEAKQIADQTFSLLAPHCDLIHIVGSVRREKSEVKDIEICCIPKKVFAATDLFGGGEWSISPDFINILKDLYWHIVKGKIDGRYMQLVLKQGINLDLFMPEPNDYYRQYAIRTGSADYSQKVIAAGWLKIGWCGSDMGLRLQKDCIGTKDAAGKTLWKCGNKNGELPPVWKSEQEFFEWINVKYIHPSKRYL